MGCAGEHGAVHRPQHAAPWEVYCSAAHAAADVQISAIMASKERAADAHERSARILRYCTALQTLSNPVSLAKRFQVGICAMIAHACTGPTFAPPLTDLCTSVHCVPLLRMCFYTQLTGTRISSIRICHPG